MGLLRIAEGANEHNLAGGADTVTGAHADLAGGSRLPPSHEALVLEAPRLQAFNREREMRSRRPRIDQAIHAGELTDGKRTDLLGAHDVVVCRCLS